MYSDEGVAIVRHRWPRSLGPANISHHINTTNNNNMQTSLYYEVQTEIVIATVSSKQLKRNYLMDRCFVHSLLWLQQHSTSQRAQASPVGRQIYDDDECQTVKYEYRT